jgi:uncharacterized protein YraI
MRTKLLALAAGAALIAGTGVASAATVTGDLHLRAGPGSGYPVIDTMPAGAHVNIRNCTGGWCRLSWNGETGWASHNFLAGGRRTTTVYRSRRVYEPSYSEAYVVPGYAYGPAYDYDYGPYAYAPSFSIGFGFGGGGWHHHGWHHWHH